VLVETLAQMINKQERWLIVSAWMCVRASHIQCQGLLMKVEVGVCYVVTKCAEVSELQAVLSAHLYAHPCGKTDTRSTIAQLLSPVSLTSELLGKTLCPNVCSVARVMSLLQARVSTSTHEYTVYTCQDLAVKIVHEHM
jgi:hypothetical protein